MKYAHIYTLFLMFVFHTSCGQNQTNVPQDNISKGHYSESQLKEVGHLQGAYEYGSECKASQKRRHFDCFLLRRVSIRWNIFY